jgi:hypothetical protein
MCLQILTIQKELDITVSPEFQKIREENEVLRTEIARHAVERSDLKELRTEIEDLKSMSYNVTSKM